MTIGIKKLMDLYDTLRIGTRSSPLALIQTKLFIQALKKVYPQLPDHYIQILPFQTSGDKCLDKSLADTGGKGLFTKELDQALCDGAIHLAVHSMKDVETHLHPDIVIGCVLKREDPRDVFISRDQKSFQEIPAGSVIGTASMRRQAQILWHRPDLKTKLIRGNVQTRLQKVQDGLYDGTLLALAGLKRIGLEASATQIFEIDEILPAAGQGVIGVCYYKLNESMREILEPINHEPTWKCLVAERSMLQALDGSCQTPIGAYAQVMPDETIHLLGLLADPSGHPLVRSESQHRDPYVLGQTVACDLRHKI
jgi:hydroxymethylbilane synthase